MRVEFIGLFDYGDGKGVREVPIQGELHRHRHMDYVVHHGFIRAPDGSVVEDSDKWAASHPGTGRGIAKQFRSVDDLVAVVTEGLNEAGKSEVNKRIALAVAEQGTRPYRVIDEQSPADSRRAFLEAIQAEEESLWGKR